MPKNPYFVCFNSPITDEDIKFLQNLSYEFEQIFPHAFWLAADCSPSKFERIISDHFVGKDHFYALIQKNQRIIFHFVDQDKQSREL